MMNLDLAGLAAETAEKLSQLWDEIGVESTERELFLQQLTEEVANIYNSRVASQEERKAEIEAEIVFLANTIATMSECMEEETNVSENTNLSLSAYRDMLESIRVNLQETWDARFNKLKDLESNLFFLYSELAEMPEENFKSVGDRMSLLRISQYEHEIQRCMEVKTQRGLTITNLCEEICSLWGELGSVPSEDISAQIMNDPASLGYASSTITDLQSRLETLLSEKSVREERIMIIGQQITALWKRLSTPEEEQTEFLESHAGIGDDVIIACEAYLALKQKEFTARLVDLIANSRAGITAQWNELHMGENQRQTAFPAFFATEDEYSDELYLAHEAYSQTLSVQLELCRPLLRAIEKRDQILAEREEYEALMADPSRLLAKGSSSARLREEKLERRIKKELPAVTKRLRQQCIEFETEHGTPFIINDARYVDILDAEEEAENKAKEEARGARAQRNALAATAAPSAASTMTSTMKPLNATVLKKKPEGLVNKSKNASNVALPTLPTKVPRSLNASHVSKPADILTNEN